MSAETDFTSAHNDQQVVGRLLTKLEVCRRDGGDGWANAHADASRYIDDLYEQLTPHLDETKRGGARLVGATALAFVDLHYGRDAQRPRLYSGSVEQNVVATYHNGAHAREFMRGMLAYMVQQNQQQAGQYDDDDLAMAPAVGATHDAVMGNGRGADERQSGLFAVALSRWLGAAGLRPQALRATIEATTWDSVKSAQAVRPERGWARQQRAAAVADLLSLFDRRGPLASISLVPEDFSKQMHDRLFTSEAEAAGFRVEGASIDTLMEFIDQRPRLQQQLRQTLEGLPGFYRGFVPADAQLDQLYQERENNVAFLKRLEGVYASAEMGAVAILHMAREHAAS